jgi:hypothetical protein
MIYRPANLADGKITITDQRKRAQLGMVASRAKKDL